MNRFSVAAFVLSLTLLPGAARAEPGFGDGILELPKINLMPRAQLDGGLELIPKGELSDDPWDVPIVAGQFFTGAALNIASVLVFNKLASGAASNTTLVLWGLLQLAVTPLVSTGGITLVGDLSELHDTGFGWPLLINYGVELVLIGIKVGLGWGAGELKGAEAIAELDAVLGKFNVIDYLLHGIVVPATVTYFSIRSRGPKGMSWGARERPSPALVAEVRGTFRAEADGREETARSAAPQTSFTLSLANASF